MRRVLLVLLILAAAGAAGWYFLLRLPPGAPPTLAAQVSAEHTLIFTSLEKPDALIDKIFKSIQAHPSLLAQLPAATSETATSILGFDPATPAGWESTGIDRTTGAALVLDARLGEIPYALLKIADEPKFLQWLTKQLGAPATLVDGQLSVGTKPPFMVARRGEYTLIAQRVALTDLQTIAKDDGPRLPTAPGFDAAFSETTRKGRLTTFIPLKGIKTIGPFASSSPTSLTAQSIDFYEALFPALGGELDAETIRLRLATSEVGLSALKQLYAPRRAAPKFSQWLPPEGFVLARASVNLFEVFEGIQALLPPAVPAQMRTQLGFAKMGMAMVGLDWSLLTQAFTGHAAFAIRPMDGRDPDFVALLALGTPESADKIIASLEAKVPQLLGGLAGGGKTPIEKVTVAGQPGRTVAIGPMQLTIVRSDAMLILASSPALATEAIERARGGAGLTGRAAAMMDDNVIMAVHAQLSSLMSKKNAAALPADGTPPLEASIRLDRHGVVFEARTLGLAVAAASLGKANDDARNRAVRAQAEQLKKIEALQDAQRNTLGQP